MSKTRGDATLGAIVVILIFTAMICSVIIIVKENARIQAPNITISELALHKEEYAGDYVTFNGTLVERLTSEVDVWFLFIPIWLDLNGDGVDDYMYIMTIPIVDEYYVYRMSDGNASIAVAFKEQNLDHRIGESLTVNGKVDGVKDANEVVLDYIVFARVW